MAPATTSPSSAPRTDAAAVLIIDDDAATRKLVATWLGKGGLQTLEAADGPSGLLLATERAERIDCIVLDVMMPGLDGFAVLRALRSHVHTARIPVVLLTAHATTDDDVVRSAEAGADEHISKPFSGPVLVAKIRLAVERARAERALRDRLRFAEENAAVDPLTSLFNRRHFTSRIAEVGASARRYRTPVALLMFDLDHFKAVNDNHGHAEGDRVLVHVAAALRSILRREDLGFRYGGEEFLVVLQMCDAAQGLTVGERLRALLKASPIALGGKPYTVTFSGGIAAADEHNDFRVDNLVERADAALYNAKRQGRDRVLVALG